MPKATTPIKAEWVKAMVDALDSYGSIAYEELVSIGVENVPPGIAIRKYRNLYEWQQRRKGREHVGMLKSAEQQIRSGARRVIVKAIWSMEQNGTVVVQGAGKSKTVTMTTLGREKTEYLRTTVDS